MQKWKKLQLKCGHVQASSLDGSTMESPQGRHDVGDTRKEESQIYTSGSIVSEAGVDGLLKYLAGALQGDLYTCSWDSQGS